MAKSNKSEAGGFTPLSLSEIRDSINSELGQSIGALVPKEDQKVRSGLSTGSLSLNYALSGGPFVGFGWGRIVEVFGPPQSGKSTLCLHCVAEAQEMERQTGENFPCVYVDAEHAIDPDYASNILDVDNLGFSQPDSGEQALEIVRRSVLRGARVVIVDSVAALTPQAELNGEIGDSHVGLQARMMAQALRILHRDVSRMKAIVIFINQLRFKIGVQFGNPETTPGGEALKFYSSYRLDVRSPRGGAQKEKSLGSKGEETGIETNVKVIKNKLFPPYRRASFVIDYGRGINRIDDALRYLEETGAFNGDGIRLLDKEYSKKGLKLALKSVEVQRALLDYINAREET